MEWQQLLRVLPGGPVGELYRGGGGRLPEPVRPEPAGPGPGSGARLPPPGASGQPFALTPAGEKLLDFSRTLLAGYETLKEELHELKGTNQGTLRLAAAFTTLYRLLPEALLVYRRLFPQVDLTLLDRSQAAVLDLVKEGEVDFGLALESLAPKELAARRWQPLVPVLLPPGPSPGGRQAPQPAEIRRYPLIRRPGTPATPGAGSRTSASAPWASPPGSSWNRPTWS